MRELLIKIKALFDGTGTDQAAQGIKKVGDEASKAESKLTQYAKAIPGIGALVGGIAGGAALIGSAFKIASDSLRAFAASEVEMAKLDAALANSGQFTDEYREKLSRLATARSQATAIDDEKYLSVFTTLTKFGADTSNIEKYTTAVENLAGFLGGDMDQAAFLFGKAMQGSTEMLGRYGISVDKSKDSTAQLADIMRQIEARGGGQLEAQANTLQGSFSKVQNAWENLLESMGSAAGKSGLTQALSNWAAGVQIIADKLGGGAPTRSTNREELIGATPDIQIEADKIANQRRELEKLKALKQQDSAEAFAKMDGLTPINPNRKPLQSQIDSNDNVISQIDTALALLDAKQNALNITTGTPAEAQAAREQQALRNGSTEFAPGGDLESIAKAKAAYEKDLEDRRKFTDDLTLGAKWKSDLKDLNAKPEQFAFSRPIADRLTQIGGFNGGRGSATTERRLDDISKWTERTASAVEKLAGKRDPQPQVVNTF